MLKMVSSDQAARQVFFMMFELAETCRKTST